MFFNFFFLFGCGLSTLKKTLKRSLLGFNKLQIIAALFLFAWGSRGTVVAQTYTQSATTYSWDAPTTNVTTTSCDGCSYSLAIPFTFTYFGNNYTSCTVSADGYMYFGATTESYTNTCLPNSGTPNNLIACYWDDLYFDYGCAPTVWRYQTFGTTPNRSFVVSWVGFRRYGAACGNYVYTQIKLFEASNNIEVHVQSNTLTTNNSGTIGIENSGGTTGYQAICNTNPGGGVAWRWTPVNIAPDVSYNTQWPVAMYGGQTYTIITDHTDANGPGNVVLCWLGLGINVDGGGGWDLSMWFNPYDNTYAASGGGAYYTLNSATKASITNGWRITWSVTLDWDWAAADDIVDLDPLAETDDQVTYTGYYWDNNYDYENDVRIYSVSYTSPQTYSTLFTVTGVIEYDGVTTPDPPDVFDVRIDPDWTVTNYDDNTCPAGAYSIDVLSNSVCATNNFTVTIYASPAGAGITDDITNSITTNNCCTAPGVPSLTSPADNAYIKPGNNQYFEWSTPTGTPPFTYDLYFDAVSVWSGATTNTTYRIPGDYSGGSCGAKAWYVTATNACGTGTSATRTLNVYPKYASSSADFSITPTTSCQTTNSTIVSYEAKYYSFTATAGETYYFGTCGNGWDGWTCGTTTGWDTWLGIYYANDDCIPVISDDDAGACGTESFINGWVCGTTGTYYLKVAPYSTQTGTYYLQYRKTVACTTPGTPTTLSTTSITSTGATFNWAAGSPVGSATVTYYWAVGVGAGVTYEAGYTARGTTTGLTASTSSLSCGNTYYWTVKSCTDCGAGSCSAYPAAISFSTTACPGSVTLNNPFDNYRKTYNIDFDWTAAPANYYNIIVDDNYSFASPVYNVNQAGNTYTISATLTNTYTYYWKVRASNDGGVTWSGFSAIRSFTYDSGITTADWYQNCYDQFNQGTPGGTNPPVIDNTEADPPTDNSRIKLP